MFAKLDFESGSNPFKASGQGRVELGDDPAAAISGRYLHIARAAEGGYFGGLMPVEISGSANLRIAFLIRARSMHRVAVNVFDERRQDNTTPASPARITDDTWRPVVFAVEDFHYNSGQPDQKIDADTRFASVFFHGFEAGASPAISIDKLAIYRGPDRTPPAAPSDVQATPEPDGSVTLRWHEPADETFAVVYSIYRKQGPTWQKIAESLQPVYRDQPFSIGTLAYRITAADYDDNVSAPSPEVTATVSQSQAVSTAAAVKPSAQVADRMNYAAYLRTIRERRAGKVRHDVFLFAGDSITAAARYTHILGSWLARGLPVRQGVGTVTAEYGAANIQKYLADAQPEFAVIMYGTNDVGRGIAISDSMSALSAIVDACLESGTVPVLATIPPRGYDPRSQGAQERYNRAVIQLARQRRVPVSYVFEEMIQHDLKTVLSDGVHLLPERGNDLAGRALRRTMDQVYFALRDTSGRW